MIKNISNLGDAALYCDFGTEVNKEINRNVINYFNNLRDSNFLGITNITPSYNKLVISFDLKLTSFAKLKKHCLLYTSPSPRDSLSSRMPSSA